MLHFRQTSHGITQLTASLGRTGVGSTVISRYVADISAGPPQSNYPPDAVPEPDNGLWLEAQNPKGGIPRLAPRELALPLHSLPPILDNEHQTSTSSCSKGSRGLSVQPRVLGIFTETTVSPDPSLRQRPSRYAIRAGRNFALFLCFQRRRLSLHLDR